MKQSEPIRFKLLLIDDDEEEYILLKKTLSKSKTLSIKLDWVSNFDEGINLSSQVVHDIYCIDFNLGNRTGLELIEEIKKAGCDRPIILLTGIDDDMLGMKAIKQGAEDYLVKGEITTHLLERSILYSFERHKAKKHEQDRINQEMIKKNEQLLTDVLNSLSAQIAVINANAHIIRVNKAWSVHSFDYGGIELHEQIKEGKNYLSILKEHAQDTGISEAIAGIKQVLTKSQDEFRIEFSVGDNEKKQWFLLQATPLQNKEGGAVISHTDITQRVQLEKLKDEFLSIASHELKTPLTTIKGYIQLLTKYIQQEGTAKMIQYIRQADIYTDKLNQLITSLLDISRIQAGKLILNKESVKLSPIIANVVEAMQHLSDKHTLVYKGDTSLLVLVDKERIEQVLMNLISNAMKYTPTTSKILITLKQKNDHALVSIQDHGIGIEKEDQKHLFQRFFRVKNTTKNYSGLGIGLYISYEIVERHGGTIWVESKPNKGSTFYFTVPLHI